MLMFMVSEREGSTPCYCCSFVTQTLTESAAAAAAAAAAANNCLQAADVSTTLCCTHIVDNSLTFSIISFHIDLSAYCGDVEGPQLIKMKRGGAGYLLLLVLVLVLVLHK
jgi:hypothetical protein